MTYEDKESYDSTPLCISETAFKKTISPQHSFVAYRRGWKRKLKRKNTIILFGTQPEKETGPGWMAQTPPAEGRAATERFSTQSPRDHWSGPES